MESFSSQDLISVIIPTYNRPQVLNFAIRSVLTQDHSNLELLVIGDHCSESTQNLIDSFDDPRLNYYNLPDNCGEQSGPNNFGLSIAKGAFIAFLNHDDIFFPDHLSSLLASISERECDLVYSLFAELNVYNTKRIKNAFIEKQFDTQEGYPASTMFFKREVYLTVGGWKNFREMFEAPSQEWIGNVYKSGATIGSSNHLSLLRFPSRNFENSYMSPNLELHEKYWEKMHHDYAGLRVQLLNEQIVILNKYCREPRLIFYVFLLAISKILIKPFGVSHPATILARLRLRRKGHIIDNLRKKRGLHKLN